MEGRKKAKNLAEQVKSLAAAGMLKGDELGAVLTSLGSDGAESDRLAAVIALLAHPDSGSSRPVGGAFAGLGSGGPADPMVTNAFTSALHGCLREQPVNAGSPATTRSA